MNENIYDTKFNGMYPCQIQKDDEFLISVDEYTLFKWEQYDAWYNPGYGGYIQVFDRKEDNCIIGEKMKTLSTDAIEEIKLRINQSKVAEISLLETSGLLDGYIDLFYFSDGMISNGIKSFNIGYHRSNPDSNAGRILVLKDSVLKIIGC